uniref:SAM domain-containing protein n=1 Tax=Gouania willdenowi TaxID=441366 RepID=A0A8C5DXT7_GOUWI
SDRSHTQERPAHLWPISLISSNNTQCSVNVKLHNADKPEEPPDKWTDSQVSAWLRSIGVKENYIEEIYKAEVDGQILLSLNKDNLMSKISMKSGPAFLIIQKRNDPLRGTQTRNLKLTTQGHQQRKCHDQDPFLQCLVKS